MRGDGEAGELLEWHEIEKASGTSSLPTDTGRQTPIAIGITTN